MLNVEIVCSWFEEFMLGLKFKNIFEGFSAKLSVSGIS